MNASAARAVRRQLIDRGWARWPDPGTGHPWEADIERIAACGNVSANDNAEQWSEGLFDVARSPRFMASLENVLQHRLVPLRTRVIAPARHAAEGSGLQDQATYRAHFPEDSYGVSIIIPSVSTSIREAAPYPGHGTILPHTMISDRVWGAQVEESRRRGPRAATACITVRGGQALVISSYFCHCVPLSGALLVSFDYRTSPYRQELDPVARRS